MAGPVQLVLAEVHCIIKSENLARYDGITIIKVVNENYNWKNLGLSILASVENCRNYRGPDHCIGICIGIVIGIGIGCSAS